MFSKNTGKFLAVVGITLLRQSTQNPDYVFFEPRLQGAANRPAANEPRSHEAVQPSAS